MAFVVMLAAAIFFVMRYARMVRHTPSLSLMSSDATESEKRSLYQHADNSPALIATARQKLAAIASFAFFAVLIYGVL